MTLVFASANNNKILEIKRLLPPDITLLSLKDIGCFDDIPETADTIEGNAALKANYVAERFGCDCFADDSGLEITALGGAPGVYSARYAGPQRNSDDNIDKVLNALETAADRSAQFKTVIALNIANRQHLFTGIIKGTITAQRKGDSGFGYDPIFRPEGMTETFAEMPMAQKASISHRGLAVRQMIGFLEKHIR